MRLFLGCLCWLSFCAASAQTAPDASAALPAEAARLNAAYRAGLETIAKDYDASLLPLAVRTRPGAAASLDTDKRRKTRPAWRGYRKEAAVIRCRPSRREPDP
jgi:hypothetical protein